MFQDETDIAKAIYDRYLAKLDSLPVKERMHFMRRAYRLTGDSQFGDPILEATLLRTVPAVRRRHTTLQSILTENSAYPEVKLPPGKVGRYRRRNDFLRANPEVQFFRRHLMNLFQAKTSAAHKIELRDEWSEIVATLKRVDYDALYIRPAVLTHVSSFAVNSVCFLKHLGVDSGLMGRFVGYMRGAYLDDDLNAINIHNNDDFVSLIYNLTHVIIAESEFYQKTVKGYRWIADYFALNMPHILEKCSMDTIAEVGLSLKLMNVGPEYSDASSAVIAHIASTFREEDYLSEAALVKREHTNAVIMLMLWPNFTWHRGPRETAPSRAGS